jgi:hypothetical protein
MHNKNISHNKFTVTLLLGRLLCKIRTHPIPLPIGFLFLANVYLARIAIKTHGYRNTAGERLWGHRDFPTDDGSYNQNNFIILTET